jgi:hypothetical protein
MAAIGAAITALLSCTPLADAPGSVFIGGACLFWAAFVIVRAWQDGASFRYWGFRRDNLGAAIIPACIVFAVGSAGLGAVAWAQGTLQLPVHALPMFLIYPVWGVIQQFLMLGVVVNNLECFPALRRRVPVLVLLVALIFGLIHAGNQRLMAATFLLELGIVALYLRHRNLWPLGVLHGWLGGLFYLWVENRDLWLERFG